MKNQTNHPQPHVGLMLALFGLMSATTLLFGPARLASAQAVAPSWSFTGNLNHARYSHTATLLQNGKVLVAGGYQNGVLSSAELYDPATGMWSSTGNLNTPRDGHTATLLPNGKVLIVGANNTDIGGHNRGVNSAELYDPDTGTWSFTGNLNIARHNHTTTLLPNGKVLVAGGEDYPGRSTELYNPATGTWSFTGNLNKSREDHTATLLPNGKVLVAGSFVAFGPTAELYDPATETWSFTGNQSSEGSDDRIATLLPNGKVLVAGGFGYSCGSFLCEDFPTKSAELYDPATGKWSITGDLNYFSFSAATLLQNGKVLTVSGQHAQLYDPATGTWGTTADLSTDRSGHTATLLPNGKVLVTGPDNTAELYNPGTNPIPNQIDEAQFFVRQHYRDFLNREADPEGLAFWTNEITLCGGDAQCLEVKRINDSASFFLSIEFQQTGYLVYRLYKASYGDLPNAPVSIRFSEFVPDTQEIGQNVIVNRAGWEQTLENNKQAFTAEFVQRQRFVSVYSTSLSPDAFVDALFANAGVTPASADRSAAIAEFGTATNTADTAARARALRRVAENSILAQQEFNRAFVLMQYFGYLRRNPNDAPEATLDFQGYNFWLNKLNSFNGNFTAAEMVKAFISSAEYRRRFGP